MADGLGILRTFCQTRCCSASSLRFAAVPFHQLGPPDVYDGASHTSPQYVQRSLLKRPASPLAGSSLFLSNLGLRWLATHVARPLSLCVGPLLSLNPGANHRRPLDADQHSVAPSLALNSSILSTAPANFFSASSPRRRTRPHGESSTTVNLRLAVHDPRRFLSVVVGSAKRRPDGDGLDDLYDATPANHR